MSVTRDFSKRIGNVSIPIADAVAVSDQSNSQPAAVTAAAPTGGPVSLPTLLTCKTVLKEGCYIISFVPNTTITVLGPRFQGTLRVENLGGGAIRFSGDLYSAPPLVILGGPTAGVTTAVNDRVERIRLANQNQPDGVSADAPGVIPIFGRKLYSSYLKGTAANLSSTRLPVVLLPPCSFSLDFDEFKYTQPATGFSGTFPSTPTRSLRFALQHTATPDSYTGRLMQGATDLGALSVRWVSPFFRRATLSIFQLTGAVDPPAAVGTETFSTVFQTANWDLSFNFEQQIPLPPPLVNVQDPNQCWSQANCATLMSSIPGYNPAVLDSVWRAILIAIPAKLGCSRGQMFDTGAGNPNNIAREGAVTNSNDGYPTTDSSHFGVAQNGLQKDFPRAFLRSASHEVGHTFNQIHQELEGGTDNSIMTTTPSVADVLFSQGKSFPNDINLGFNARVRRHLVHLPDPAVRPGAMDFFGAAVNAPQADQMLWPDELKLTASVENSHIALGEPLALSWTLVNNGTSPFLVPATVDIETLVARVSVTDAHGNTVFLRPAEQKACVHNPLRELKPGESAKGSTNVYWGRDGFTFERPGHYVVDVITMWQITETWVGVSSEVHVWVSFPVSDEDNRVAALMLHPEVGLAVAAPHAPPTENALARIAEAQQLRADHPAITRLKALGHASKLKLRTASASPAAAARAPKKRAK
jgi:hypothetical protein